MIEKKESKMTSKKNFFKAARRLKRTLFPHMSFHCA